MGVETGTTPADEPEAIDDNQEEWVDLTRRLDGYMSALENQIDSFEEYPPEERVVDDAFRQPLDHYVESVNMTILLPCAYQCRFLEEFHSKLANHRHKRSRSGLAAFRGVQKVKIDVGVIRNFNRDIEDRHRQFLVRASPVVRLL